MKKIVISLFAMTSVCLVSAQNNLPRYIDSFTKANNFNGTILVEQDKKVTFHKSYGYANLESKVLNRTDTKWLTTLLTPVFSETTT